MRRRPTISPGPCRERERQLRSQKVCCCSGLLGCSSISARQIPLSGRGPWPPAGISLLVAVSIVVVRPGGIPAPARTRRLRPAKRGRTSGGPPSLLRVRELPHALRDRMPPDPVQRLARLAQTCGLSPRCSRQVHGGPAVRHPVGPSFCGSIMDARGDSPCDRDTQILTRTRRHGTASPRSARLRMAGAVRVELRDAEKGGVIAGSAAGPAPRPRARQRPAPRRAGPPSSSSGAGSGRSSPPWSGAW